MSANDKFLEQLVKEKLEGYEKNPPRWNDFEPKLKKHIKIKRFTRIGSIVGTVAAIAILTYFLIGNKHTQKELIANVPNKIIIEKQTPNNNKSTIKEDKTVLNKKTKIAKDKRSKHVSANKKKNISHKKDAENVKTSHNSALLTPNVDTISNKNVSEINKEIKEYAFEYYVSDTKGCAPLKVKIEAKGKNITKCIYYIGNNKYQSDENGNLSISLNKAGKYELSAVVTFNNGDVKTYKYAKSIEVLPTPTANFVYEKGKLIDLSLSANKIVWDIDEEYSFLNKNEVKTDFLNAGIHRVSLIAFNNACIDTLIKEIEVKEPVTVFMPNAFTPNGDGRNDEFKPVFNIVPNFYKMVIYDKGGNVVFVTTEPQKGWKGDKASEGIYVWKIIYKDNTGETIEKTGNVTLMR